ncbi:hypothetical protein [Rhodococcoides yunnanense]|uniref:hypothetical protein n=1 Tax=Rhodococcoides yunnanense TaxID=278209 RepID=UPI0022B0EA48|nr:hypothetical protein [Rhodococcus yunnanensis]MCZ4278737.1 hypothetical protein [Rhodococcus yunnanensis]
MDSTDAYLRLDDVGDVWWRISLHREAGNVPVPLAGRSDTHDAALRDMVVKARAYMAQDGGTYNSRNSLHVQRNYVQVEGVTDPQTSVDEVARRIQAAFDAAATEEAERQRRQREIDAVPVLSPTPTGSITQAWNRIERWLDEHTDTPLDHRVPEVDLKPLEGFPDELIEFLGVYSGAPYRLLPLNALLTPADIRSARASMVKIWSELEAEDPEMVVDGRSTHPAGTAAYSFLESYYPFAGLDGYLWFIDTRPALRRLVS